MPVPYTKVIPGQEVTAGMIHYLKETIGLVVDLGQLPIKFQEIQLEYAHLRAYSRDYL